MPGDDKRSLPCIYVRGFKSLAHLLNDGQQVSIEEAGPPYDVRPAEGAR